MKILVTTPLYYIEGRKDLKHDTNAIHYLLKYWAKEHQIVVVDTYINYRNNISKYINPGSLVRYANGYFFEKDNITVYLIENQLLTRHCFQDWNWKRLTKKINSMLKKLDFEPDIIISHFPCYAYNYIDKLFVPDNTKRIAVLHQTDVYTSTQDAEFIDGLKNNYTCCFARSAYIRDYFEDKGIHVRNIVYSGAPDVGGVMVRQWGDFHRRTIRILYAGKLIKRKRIDWIIEVLSQLQDINIEFIIVGEGEELSHLQKMTMNCGVEDKVHFYGSLERTEVIELMKTVDIFCMPSEKETYGLVYLEAMACGCLTIGTKGEGIDGIIVNNDNGFLVESKKELYTLLHAICFSKEESELSKISNSARTTGVLYSESNVSQRYLKLVKEVLMEEM